MCVCVCVCVCVCACDFWSRWTLHILTFSVVNINDGVCPLQHEVCHLLLSVFCLGSADVSDLSSARLPFNLVFILFIY